MDKLIYLGVAFIDRIRSLVGLVIPLFAEASDFRNWPTWLKVLVHLIILGVILVGLYYLTVYLEPYLKTKGDLWVQKFYLDIVFLLIYVLIWLGYFWWKLLNRGESAEFPDIEKAWRDAMTRLRQQGVNIGDYPLYLVLGRPAAGDDALFMASQMRIGVRAPQDPNSPIRVYAGTDGIFVAAGDACTWSILAKVLENPDQMAAFEGRENDAPDVGKTIQPGQVLTAVDQGARDEFFALLRIQSERALTWEEQERLKELGQLMEKAKHGQARTVRLPADQLALGPKRLTYLCNLIRKDRRPWCPINGVLVLVPWRSLESDEVSREAMPVLSGDLAAARKGFAMRYPHYVMICDLEQADGYDEFKRVFPKEMQKQRIGQRLPLVPDRPPSESPLMMEKAAEWICTNVMASWVLKFLRLEWPADLRKSSFVPSYNERLFQFLHGFHVRGPWLSRLLSRGLPGDSSVVRGEAYDELPLCGGCYLAATGRVERDQMFVTGVFQRLTESQSAVSWSPAAIEEDRMYRLWSVVLFAAVVLTAVVGGALLYRLFVPGK